MPNPDRLRAEAAVMLGQSRREGSLSANRSIALTDFGLLAGFFVLITVLGQFSVSVTRVIFVIGCVGFAIRAYRNGGFDRHAQTTTTLFIFSPLLRRIVDLHAGYDSTGSMLIGPLLALAVVFPTLKKLVVQQKRSIPSILPYFGILICLLYGWSLSAFQGDLIESTILVLKYAIPVIYALCIIIDPSVSNGVLDSVAKTFLILSPFLGLYGIYQHLAPQPWDRYWMIESRIDSIGLPEPGQVRVFGTMNSPVSFAAYAICGILLFTFVRQSFLPPLIIPLIAILPLSLALLLTGVRTAWISAFLSIAICTCFKKLRKRSFILLLCLVSGTFFALSFTSFGDTIGNRLNSLSGNVSSDGSGGARIDDYNHVFLTDNSRYFFGIGFGSNQDVELNALDGLLLSSAVRMGTIIGVLHVVLVLFVGFRAALSVRHTDTPIRLVACSLVVGSLMTSLLTNISIGEIGFLYWMMVGVLESIQDHTEV